MKRAFVCFERLFQVNVDEVDNPFDKGVGEPMFNALVSPGRLLLYHLPGALDLFGDLQQAIGGVGPAVEDDVFHAL